MMEPQAGDIWEWTQDDDICPVLLLKPLGKDTYFGMVTLKFKGYEISTGKYDEFYFHSGNKKYWRKV